MDWTRKTLSTAALLALAACKHGAPAPSALDAGAPTAPSAEPTPDLPAAWVACATDADCVALPSACCVAWPSNVASRASVQAKLAASDAARPECRDRVCAMQVPEAACDHGRCVVR